MRLSVPPVKGVDVKHRTGVICQLMAPDRDIEGEWTRFVLPSVTGHMLVTVEGEVLYAFPKPPEPDQLPVDGTVLVGPILDGAVGHIDLKESKWLVHSAIGGPDAGITRARESWLNGFRYVGDDEAGEGRIGLRRPQMGAIHVAAGRGNEPRTFVAAIKRVEAALHIAGLSSLIQPSLLQRERVFAEDCWRTSPDNERFVARAPVCSR